MPPYGLAVKIRKKLEMKYIKGLFKIYGAESFMKDVLGENALFYAIR